MKKIALVYCFFILSIFSVFAQQKYALVIGNGAYSGISRLNNPVNDANDMAATLQGLGFTVNKVLNGNLEQMENAVTNLSRQLSKSRNSYGFFFYAGHGVQASGENYLIPVEASNIQNETQLRLRAVSLQSVMESLSDAGNELNMIVLDACRENPFGWSRSTTRGLTVVRGAPTGSIVMYATSANSVAEDGNGRNGLFTSHLLNNLKTSGLSVFEVFDRIMGDVIKAASGRQHPELSLRFSGATSAYLGSRPVQPSSPNPSPPVTVQLSAKDHFDKGKIFFDRDDDNTAILEFTEAIRLDPNYSDAYAYRARAYNGKEDYDRALADGNTALRLNPNNAIAYYGRGNTYYYGKSDYDRAIADLAQAIRLNPNYALAYYSRGNIYDEKKDYDRAIADYTQAIKINSNYADVYIDRGAMYHNVKKDYDRAIADYTQAIRINPNYAMAYNNRGLSYQAKGDTVRANADFAKARELGYR